MPQQIAEGVPKRWGIGRNFRQWVNEIRDFLLIYANIFYPFLLKSKVTFPVILFVDGHKIHLTYQLSKLCTDLKIILIALYPNATRILQPADVSCFRPLKALWKRGVLKWRRSNPFCQLTKIDFVPILNEIISELVPESISNGFRACGLSPGT
ncbi:hypothetical protein NQ314_017294 [Rhamnusium bicolor]|uniref:DDE-1 domain-containing protein n=1 Tax=Rhamnusium bicolor TaxID=1586634 RepID=A0AAV8WU20_9CUCU|nr:hypothetical protein NQ314_017294 [Rhamnusium bicolor]